MVLIDGLMRNACGGKKLDTGAKKMCVFKAMTLLDTITSVKDGLLD